MSGCPGAGRWPVFAGGAWLPDMEGLWDEQWAGASPPTGASSPPWAAEPRPASTSASSCTPARRSTTPPRSLLLAEVTGEQRQGQPRPEPLLVAGDRPGRHRRALAGRIGFAHGKDTLVHPDRVALHGVLDFRWPGTAAEMPWHFAAVGRGRPATEWRALIAALGRGGLRRPDQHRARGSGAHPRGGHRGVARTGCARRWSGLGGTTDGGPLRRACQDLRHDRGARPARPRRARRQASWPCSGPRAAGRRPRCACWPGSSSPPRGTIFIGDRDVTLLEPRHRDIAMVFQSYALYPHKTVAENIAYPLAAAARSAKAERDERVRKVAELLGHRRPARPRARASCPAASASGSRSPGRSSAARRRS